MIAVANNATPMTTPIPMPAFAPVLSVWDGGFVPGFVSLGRLGELAGVGGGPDDPHGILYRCASEATYAVGKTDKSFDCHPTTTGSAAISPFVIVDIFENVAVENPSVP